MNETLENSRKYVEEVRAADQRRVEIRELAKAQGKELRRALREADVWLRRRGAR